MRSNRLMILDGLRTIAILLVLLFHYYSRYKNNLYEYSFNIPVFIEYGYLGVQLFFIISGFVITLSLYKTHRFTVFIKNRFIRLLPAMVICATITFLFKNLFDNENLFENSKNITNLLISITFINPDLVNLFTHTNLNYIDGAYWSLWVEISFYFIAGILYFISPLHLLRNFSIIVFLGFFSHFIFISNTGFRFFSPIISESVFMLIRGVFKTITFFEHSLWFLGGMLLQKLYQDKKNLNYLFYFFFIMVLQLLFIFNSFTLIFMSLTVTVFLLFIYKPHFISILGNKLLSRLGVASYAIYLVHQNIGVLIINKLGGYFGEMNWILPLILIFILGVFGIYFYKFVEKPISKRLKESDLLSYISIIKIKQ